MRKIESGQICRRARRAWGDRREEGRRGVKDEWHDEGQQRHEEPMFELRDQTLLAV